MAHTVTVTELAQDVESYLQLESAPDSNELEELERQIMLYERLEHKEEFLDALDTYVMKLVRDGNVERMRELIKRYDSQYEVSKKLFIKDNIELDGFIMGMNKTELVSDRIKPKVEQNEAMHQALFK